MNQNNEDLESRMQDLVQKNEMLENNNKLLRKQIEESEQKEKDIRN